MPQNPPLLGLKRRKGTLVPMLFPVFGAYISGTKFLYLDLKRKEKCGIMANLVAKVGGNRHMQTPSNSPSMGRKHTTLKVASHAGAMGNSCRSVCEHMLLRSKLFTRETKHS